MGKIQSISLKTSQDVQQMIETSYLNKNTALDKKIFEEFSKLKIYKEANDVPNVYILSLIT